MKRLIIILCIILVACFAFSACNSSLGNNDGNSIDGGAENGGAENGGAENGGAENGGAGNGGAENGGAGNGGAENGGAENGGAENGGAGNGGAGNGGAGNGSTGNGNTGNGSTGNGSTGNGGAGNGSTGSGIVNSGEIESDGNNRPGDEGLKPDEENKETSGNGEDIGLIPDPEGTGSAGGNSSLGTDDGTGLIPDPEGSGSAGGNSSSLGTDDGTGLIPDPDIDKKPPKEPLRILYVDSSLKFDVDEYGEPCLKNSSAVLVLIRCNGENVYLEDMYTSTEEIPEEKLSGYDLYVFVGVTEPEVLPTDGAIWYFNTEPTSLGVQFGDEQESPDGYKFKETDENSMDNASEIIKYRIDIEKTFVSQDKEIYIATSKYMELEDKPEELISIYETPSGDALILAGEINNQKIILFTFAIENSSLPLFLTEAPLLFKNMLRYID